MNGFGVEEPSSIAAAATWWPLLGPPFPSSPHKINHCSSGTRSCPALQPTHITSSTPKLVEDRLFYPAVLLFSFWMLIFCFFLLEGALSLALPETVRRPPLCRETTSLFGQSFLIPVWVYSFRSHQLTRRAAVLKTCHKLFIFFQHPFEIYLQTSKASRFVIW